LQVAPAEQGSLWAIVALVEQITAEPVMDAGVTSNMRHPAARGSNYPAEWDVACEVESKMPRAYLMLTLQKNQSPSLSSPSAASPRGPQALLLGLPVVEVRPCPRREPRQLRTAASVRQSGWRRLALERRHRCDGHSTSASVPATTAALMVATSTGGQASVPSGRRWALLTIRGTLSWAASATWRLRACQC
jgi:hypothetical protein